MTRRILPIVATALWIGASAPAANIMPAAQQNALVQKYCAVCHTDSARNGGLSLQHFDAANSSPSLLAMMLSKLTGGVSLETARNADSSASAADLVHRKAKSGAIGAAGIPIPDPATIDAWTHAFALESAGAFDWAVQRQGPDLTASILREKPSATNAGEAESYRLIVSCKAEAREGSVQLAWSPVAHTGTLAASMDGNTPLQYKVEGSEAMGNGSGLVLHGVAALTLSPGGRLPSESLTIGELVPGETLAFSFADFPKDARRDAETCFPTTK